MIVLTFNSGSSSLKFGLFRVAADVIEPMTTGSVEGGALHSANAQGNAQPCLSLPTDTGEAAVAAIATLLASGGLPPPDAIGHRIVHGGPKLRRHRLLDGATQRAIETAGALSPLHTAAALGIIRAARATWPTVPQTVCFDTAFHTTMPDLARTLPVAHEMRAMGVERFGFHGLSCESIVRQLGSAVPARLIIAHLGSGASVTALRDGCSIDTSMGLTPSGGIVMATRSGDLDPGILLYLQRERGMPAARLAYLIDHRSGLLGISGLSGDLRALHQAQGSNPDARLAIAIFCSSVAKAIAGMIVALDGIDAIIFTGGIGEHDATTRAAICALLGCFGIMLNPAANDAGCGRFDAADSSAELYVLPSREDEQMARHAYDLMTN